MGLDHHHISFGAGQDGLVHGWHRRVPGGPCLFQPAKEFQGIEARGAEHRAAAGERCQHRGNKAVNVKQRHDVQAAVGADEAKGAGDIVGGCSQVALRQRHDFRPRSGARGVQNERCFIGAQKTAIGGFAPDERMKGEVSGYLMGLEVNDCDAEAGRGRHGGRDTAAIHDQRLDVQIFHIVAEFVFAEGRVERSRDAAG